MRQTLLGRPTTRWLPLPVELERKPGFRSLTSPAAVREVPFIPTPPHVVDEMLHAAGVTDKDLVYDPGCGDGRILIAAAQTRGARGVGIELGSVRIESARQAAHVAGVTDKVRYINQSLFDVDFSPATVVMLYLLPWANAMLRPILLAQLRPGSRIVSHSFSFEDWTPDRTIRIPGDRVIYLWIVPAMVSGPWHAAIRLPTGRTHHATLQFEQEFQVIVGNAHLDGHDIPLDPIGLYGDRLHFTLNGLIYHCHVDGPTLRGAAATPRGPFEIRARRA